MILDLLPIVAYLGLATGTSLTRHPGKPGISGILNTLADGHSRAIWEREWRSTMALALSQLPPGGALPDATRWAGSGSSHDACPRNGYQVITQRQTTLPTSPSGSCGDHRAKPKLVSNACCRAGSGRGQRGRFSRAARSRGAWQRQASMISSSSSPASMAGSRTSTAGKPL